MLNAFFIGAVVVLMLWFGAFAVLMAAFTKGKAPYLETEDERGARELNLRMRKKWQR